MTTVYAALAAVMADVGHVSKRDHNTHQNFLFRGIDAVLNAVGPALRTHGVIVVPQVTSAVYETVQTSTGKPATACRVKVAYLFFGPEGDVVETSVIGEAWDSGDKAAPKAMSVAFRTALLQALALPTDEPDPDTHTYERAAHTDTLDGAKARAWAALRKRKPHEDNDALREYTSAALEARGSSLAEASAATWNQLASEWEQS